MQTFRDFWRGVEAYCGSRSPVNRLVASSSLARGANFKKAHEVKSHGLFCWKKHFKD